MAHGLGLVFMGMGLGMALMAIGYQIWKDARSEEHTSELQSL